MYRILQSTTTLLLRECDLSLEMLFFLLPGIIEKRDAVNIFTKGMPMNIANRLDRFISRKRCTVTGRRKSGSIRSMRRDAIKNCCGSSGK